MSDFASDLASIDILTNIDLLRNVRAPIEARRQAAIYLAKNPNMVALPVMIKALEDPDFEIRKNALQTCATLRSPLMIDPLIRVVREGTFSEREDAIRILGELRDRRAMQAVMDAHTLSDWMSIRSTAAIALGKMGYTEAVPALLEGLQDFEAPVRASAAEALGNIGDARAVEPLVAALKREKGWNVRHMATALGKIGLAAMQGLLETFMSPAEEQSVRETAAETLAEIITQLQGEALAEAQPYIMATVDAMVREISMQGEGVRGYIVRAALTRISRIASDALINAFAYTDANTRDQVAYILGDSPDETLNSKLIAALTAPDPQIAAGAARVLYFRGVNPRDHHYTGPL